MLEVKQIAVDKFIITLGDNDIDLIIRLAERLSLDNTNMIQTMTTVGMAMFTGLFSMEIKSNDSESS